MRAWVFGPIVTIVVTVYMWSDFLRSNLKKDRKLTVMSQTYPGPIKKPLSRRMQISCKKCNFCRNPIGCYVWVAIVRARGVIGKMRARVRRMIYTFEGSYWRTRHTSQHASVLRLSRYIAIKNLYASISAALIRTCGQVGTSAHASQQSAVFAYTRTTPL